MYIYIHTHTHIHITYTYICKIDLQLPPQRTCLARLTPHPFGMLKPSKITLGWASSNTVMCLHRLRESRYDD